MPRPDLQDMFYGNIAQEQDLANRLRGSRSAFSGLNTAGDIRSRFGLGGDTSGIYAPLHRALSRNRGDALARASARAGGSASREGSIFAPIESAYGGAEEQLYGAQGQSDLQQQQLVAQLLQGSMGAQDTYGLNQTGMLGSLLGGMNQQIGQHRQLDYQLQDPGFMDYLMQVLGMGSRVGAAALATKAGPAAAGAAAAA